MIEIKNLHKAFGPKRVLNGISFDIPTGSTFCVIGKSGCGKSVLLKHIVGLLRPDQGTVHVDSQNVHRMTRGEQFRLRRRIGYVFQGAALFDSMNVFENVVIGLFEHGVKDEAILGQEARRVLSAVGLLPPIAEAGSSTFEKEFEILRNKKPSDLSGGMRKRVGVARALAGEPEYIFYDEPTTGLDPVTSEQIDHLIFDLAARLRVTSLVITHDMFSVFHIADRVAMLDSGLVRFEGTAAELKASTDPVVVEFIDRFMLRPEKAP